MFGFVPYRFGGLARDCTILAFPGILAALAVGGSVHDYSRAFVFFGNLFFYSVVIALLLTLWFLWSRLRRAS